MLGTMEQIVAPSGVYLGHLAEIDSRGRVFSGSAHEESLREAAAVAARHAHEEGFFGPCGIDAFGVEFKDADGGTREILRPLVEFNARFTIAGGRGVSVGDPVTAGYGFRSIRSDPLDLIIAFGYSDSAVVIRQ